MINKRDFENRATFLVHQKDAYKTIPNRLSINLVLSKYMLNKRHFENRATFLSCQNDAYKTIPKKLSSNLGLSK